MPDPGQRPSPLHPCFAGVLAFAVTLLLPVSVRGQLEGPTPQCSSSRISDITIHNGSVFSRDQAENPYLRWGYGMANRLHIRTKASFIRKELLFSVGECLDLFLLEESERLLLSYRFIRHADITSTSMEDGEVAVVVTTMDEWTTQINLGLSYDEGVNIERLSLSESNFLGRGMRASISYRERIAEEDLKLRFSTERLLGRTNANIEWGSTRGGDLIKEWFTYPFLGEIGRNAGRQFFMREVDYFSYSSGGAEEFSHLLVPVEDERLEFSAARRFGQPGKLLMLGASLTRDLLTFPGVPELAFDRDFEETTPASTEDLGQAATQMVESVATRLSVHAGFRRVRFQTFYGLDALRGEMEVPLGLDLGLTLGHGLNLWGETGLTPRRDLSTRFRAVASGNPGSSLLIGGYWIEARRDTGEWQDVLAELDLMGYFRSRHVPGHTFVARAAAAGGWSTGIPFQLTLGGRQGVRAFGEDSFPGGRRVVFSVEDRVLFSWPDLSVADLGLTVFADAGRVWAGDAPFGEDSSWKGAAGIGLRMGFPSGSRKAIRVDIAFPVGSGRSNPMFRVLLSEVLTFRNDFVQDQLKRSRRFNIGPDYF
jgi:hypothetical protein